MKTRRKSLVMILTFIAVIFFTPQIVAHAEEVTSDEEIVIENGQDEQEDVSLVTTGEVTKNDEAVAETDDQTVTDVDQTVDAADNEITDDETADDETANVETADDETADDETADAAENNTEAAEVAESNTSDTEVLAAPAEKKPEKKIVTGWKKQGNDWFYFDQKGEKTVSDWVKYNFRWYYFDDKGIMVTGFAEIDGLTYYFKTNGMMATGWQKLKDEWYFFSKGGAMKTGWQKSGRKWYFMDEEDGTMQTGWNQTGKQWYYLSDVSGAMTIGWKNVDEKWYSFKTNGAMSTGWRLIGDKWYYFKHQGNMKTGWLQYKDNWYWFNEDGEMVTGSQKVDDLYYLFDSEGVCMNPEGSEIEITEEQLANIEKWSQLSDLDIYYMCRCVETETRDCDFWSKTHVASVILNRVTDPYFGDTPYKVVTARCQFAYGRTQISQSTVDAVNYVLTHGDTAQGALFFHSLSRRSTFCGRSYIFTDACGHHFYK